MDTRHNYSDINGSLPIPSELIYLIPVGSMVKFLDNLINDGFSSSFVSNFFTSQNEYVVGMKYFPLDLSFFESDSPENFAIKLGKSTLANDYHTRQINAVGTAYGGTKNTYLYNFVQIFNVTINRIHNNFLDYAPYTKIMLYIPFFEMIEIDPVLSMGKTITGYVSLDMSKGMLTLFIENSESILVAYKSTKISVDLPIGKGNSEEMMRNNILHAISFMGSSLGLGVGLMTGNPLATVGSVGLLTKNVTQAMTNNIEHLKSYSGGNGSSSGLSCDKNMKLIIETVSNVELPDPAIKGYVLKETRSLSAVTGYTEISQMNFNPNGEPIMKDEIDEIVSLLRAGVIL